MFSTLVNLWATSPRQTAHLTSAQPSAPVVGPRPRVTGRRAMLVDRVNRHRTVTAVLSVESS
jgi:hypothetical protein